MIRRAVLSLLPATALVACVPAGPSPLSFGSALSTLQYTDITVSGDVSSNARTTVQFDVLDAFADRISTGGTGTMSITLSEASTGSGRIAGQVQAFENRQLSAEFPIEVLASGDLDTLSQAFAAEVRRRIVGGA